MEEQLHRFYRLREDLAMDAARSTGDAGLSKDELKKYYAAYSNVWNSTSEHWLEFRRSAERG